VTIFYHISFQCIVFYYIVLYFKGFVNKLHKVSTGRYLVSIVHASDIKYDVYLRGYQSAELPRRDRWCGELVDRNRNGAARR
jgi:hypothetical protein